MSPTKASGSGEPWWAPLFDILNGRSGLPHDLCETHYAMYLSGALFA